MIVEKRMQRALNLLPKKTATLLKDLAVLLENHNISLRVLSI